MKPEKGKEYYIKLGGKVYTEKCIFIGNDGEYVFSDDYAQWIRREDSVVGEVTPKQERDIPWKVIAIILLIANILQGLAFIGAYKTHQQDLQKIESQR